MYCQTEIGKKLYNLIWNGEVFVIER
jgi:hypothetical protein